MTKRRLTFILCAVIAIFAVFVEPKLLQAYSVEITEVYIGGYPIGIEMFSDGPIVCDISGDNNIKKGDVIMSVNGERIHSRLELYRKLASVSAPITMDVMRNNASYNILYSDTNIDPYNENIGFTVKDGISGLGTVSCIDKNNKFYALGHAIYDNESTSFFTPRDGYVYECEISGVIKASCGKTGRLIGRYTKNKNPIGGIASNSTFGLKGNREYGMQKHELYNVMPQSEVKTGYAQIVTTVSSEREYYDIEIVKASKQSSPKEKGLIIKITDKNLIDKTSGIVQGMSGSPIIQNGKFVGAVTHVFTNDPLRGYGVYAQWILQN